MISKGLFAIHPGKIRCNNCSAKMVRFKDTTNTVWADAVQKFMEDHKISCWNEEKDVR